MGTKRYFTSESVTEGHPDKLCDQISDAILDAMLEKDPMSRVACETMAANGLLFIAGEITTNCFADIPDIARRTIREIGYTHPDDGFDDKCGITTSIDEQSQDIALGVNDALESRGQHAYDIGAGDQGMMFGFACDQTPEFMPMPISLAHKLTKRLAEVRKQGVLPYLRPDGKAQVTVEYEDGIPKRVDAIVVSSQHAPEVEMGRLQEEIKEQVVKACIPEELLDEKTKYFINPTGRFVIGGPMGDTGLTGRKIIVDTYGGYARHGGGAFSGKDPTKVDRSAAYAARHLAMNIVAAGAARECEIQLSYAIGVAQPVSIRVETFGTNQMAEERIERIIRENVDLRPKAIIDRLDLRRPIYKATAAYGHFGRPELDLNWEKLDLVDLFR